MHHFAWQGKAIIQGPLWVLHSPKNLSDFPRGKFISYNVFQRLEEHSDVTRKESFFSCRVRGRQQQALDVARGRNTGAPTYPWFNTVL
jgi:hypothetical protein